MAEDALRIQKGRCPQGHWNYLQISLSKVNLHGFAACRIISYTFL
jgi:hypothetical protein